MRGKSLAGQDRKLIPVLLGFLVLSVFGFAQDLPAGKPESVGSIFGAPGAHWRGRAT